MISRAASSGTRRAAPGSAPWGRSAGQPVAEMADPWPKGPFVAVMTGRKIGIPGWDPVEHAVIPKGLPWSCTAVPCPTPPAMADPATSRPPRPGRAPDITPRSTSRPDHVLAVRAGDHPDWTAVLDIEERGVPDAIPPAWSRSSTGGDVVALVAIASATPPTLPRLEPVPDDQKEVGQQATSPRPEPKNLTQHGTQETHERT